MTDLPLECCVSESGRNAILLKSVGFKVTAHAPVLSYVVPTSVIKMVL